MRSLSGIHFYTTRHTAFPSRSFPRARAYLLACRCHNHSHPFSPWGRIHHSDISEENSRSRTRLGRSRHTLFLDDGRLTLFQVPLLYPPIQPFPPFACPCPPSRGDVRPDTHSSAQMPMRMRILVVGNRLVQVEGYWDWELG